MPRQFRQYRLRIGLREAPNIGHQASEAAEHQGQMRSRVTIVLVGVALLTSESGAQNSGRVTTAEVFLGTAWNLPLPMTWSGSADTVRIHARFATGAFRRPFYYSIRLGRAWDGSGAELELIHHKLYLENPAPPIDQLEITHGYNFLLGNAVRPAGGWQLRLGVGLVIAHPEGRIAGQPVGGRYQLAGGTVQVALARRSALTSGRVQLTAIPEVKLTASMARFHLDQGTLVVPNVAVHAVGGLGIHAAGQSR